MTPPSAPEDTVAWVTVRLHAHGQISISGTIGERALSLSLLAHAADAVRRQIPKAGELYVPNSDVSATPVDGMREMGDIPVAERGDS
jgi:hypothetical protein